MENQETTKSGIKEMFIFGLVAIVLLAVIASWCLEVRAVRHESKNPAVIKMAAILRIPAVKVNDGKVLYSDYVRDLNTLNKFYESAPAESKPTSEQISDQAIARLITNVLVQDLSKKYQVSVNQEDVDKMRTQITSQFENESAMLAELKSKYGWTFDQYVDFVVKPLLLEQKVAAVFASSTDDASLKYEVPEIRASHILFSVADEKEDAKIKAKAESVLKRIKAGEDFAKLAKEFGSDGTKEKGGDLGWFGKGQMVQEFEDAVFALTPGQLGDKLVKTQFGYHIVRLTDKRMVRDFNLFMQDQITNAPMKFLVPIHNPFLSK